MAWKWLGIFTIAFILAASVGVFPAIVQASSEDNAEEIVVGNGTAVLVKPALSFEDALSLAYLMRNLTYDLFQWEISKGIVAANVTLNKGDLFLDRAIEMKDNNTRRATTFAFVAAIHYSHAPAFANPVLGKTIAPILNETGNVTPEVVNAVISLYNELEALFLSSSQYAEGQGYNTTFAKALYNVSKQFISNATSQLEAGNVTTAFRLSVAGYRHLVRAYAELVRSVFVQYLVDRNLITPSQPIFKGIVKGIEKALERLPAEIRERLRARVENGEIKSVKDIIGEVRKEVQQRQEIMKENEYRFIAGILTRIATKYSGHPAMARLFRGPIYDYMYDLVREVANKTGAHGPQLLDECLHELQNRAQELRQELINEMSRYIIRIGK